MEIRTALLLLNNMNTLITGCAGFIGFYLARELTKNKRYSVIGVDNLNNIDGYLKLKKN